MDEKRLREPETKRCTRKKKWKETGTILLFFGLLGAAGAATLLLPDREISLNERRRLRQAPVFSAKAVLDGQWQRDLEIWSSDQLAGRDALLALRSASTNWLYGNLDDNGLVCQDGFLIQTETEIHQDSLAHAARVFTSIYEENLRGTDCSIYLCIIPDKSYFLEQGNWLVMDYAAFFEQVQNDLSFASPISIAPFLSLDDYYYTDPHWRQESILKVAREIASSMNVSIPKDYETRTALDAFAGQSRGLTVLPARSDTLRYLWREEMKDWTVLRYDQASPKPSAVYDLARVNSLDPYEMFLSGSAGMIEIENPHGKKDRELIVFSDSFGSSMVPLLAAGYEKTILIDLRQLPGWRLKTLIDFEDQDVLFLYSTSVLNASQALK